MLCVFLCVCCTEERADLDNVPQEPRSEVSDSSCIPGEVIVKFSEDMTARIERELAGGAFLRTRSEELNSVFASLGVTSVERVFMDGGEWEPVHREAGLHTWYRVRFDSSLPVTRASCELESIPGVESSGPSPRIRSSRIFNDPRYPEQWNYYNDGSISSKHMSGCDINVEDVWTFRSAGRPEVIVAVLDGGIQMDHEDLAAVVIPAGKDGSRNFVDSEYYVITPHDHGTHVAGTIGAINDNGIGVSGIAGGKKGQGGVRLMSCQIFKPGTGDKDVSGDSYNALVWASDHGAVIANNSWTYVYEDEEQALKGGVGAMKGAIDYFNTHAGLDKKGRQEGPMVGGLVVFAAGNENWKKAWPSAYSGVVAVGSFGPGGARTSYSNYGDWVDIAAPGGNTSVYGGGILSTKTGNTYGFSQGTSMACPHVSGVAALLVSEFGGPGFTREMLLERLLGGADYSAPTVAAGIGPKLDAFGAFAYGSTMAPETPGSFSVNPHSNFMDFEWKTVADPDDSVPHGYLLLAAEDASSLEGLDYDNLPQGVHGQEFVVRGVAPGNKLKRTVSGLDFNKQYYTTLVSFDYSRNYSAYPEPQAVTTGDNHPPVITVDHSGEVFVKAHETVDIIVKVEDPDGHGCKLDFESTSIAATCNVQADGTYLVGLRGQFGDPGSYTALLTAMDDYGASTSCVIPFTVLENHAPAIVKDAENMIMAPGDKLTLNLDDYITDEDGEDLIYTVNVSNSKIVRTEVEGSELILTAAREGMVTVTVKARDVMDLKVSMTFMVKVRAEGGAPDVYPTQVVDYLSVSDGSTKEIEIVISNVAGAVLYNGRHVCDAFNPAIIDMRGWAPGRYSVTVKSEGRTSNVNVVKL